MYNIIIDGLGKDRLVIEASNLFSKMIAQGISPNVVTYNCLILGLCYVSQLEEAAWLLNDMVLNNINPDPYTYNILFDALCKGDVNATLDALHGVILISYILSKSLTTKSLIVAYLSQFFVYIFLYLILYSYQIY